MIEKYVGDSAIYLVSGSWKNESKNSREQVGGLGEKIESQVQ